MPSIFSSSFRKYKDIIKVYYIIVVQYIIKNIVNIVLKYSQGVIKAKQGYQYLIEPKAGNKCYKLLIAFSDIDSIKRGNNIKLSIELSAGQGIKRLIDKRKRVLVLNGNVIIYTNLIVQVSRIQGHEIRIVSYAHLDGSDLLLVLYIKRQNLRGFS